MAPVLGRQDPGTEQSTSLGAFSPSCITSSGGGAANILVVASVFFGWNAADALSVGGELGFDGKSHDMSSVVVFGMMAEPALKAPPTSFCENTSHLPFGSRTYIRSSLQ
jgi:hypothetical protein